MIATASENKLVARLEDKLEVMGRAYCWPMRRSD